MGLVWLSSPSCHSFTHSACNPSANPVSQSIGGAPSWTEYKQPVKQGALITLSATQDNEHDRASVPTHMWRTRLTGRQTHSAHINLGRNLLIYSSCLFALMTQKAVVTCIKVITCFCTSKMEKQAWVRGIKLIILSLCVTRSLLFLFCINSTVQRCGQEHTNQKQVMTETRVQQNKSKTKTGWKWL